MRKETIVKDDGRYLIYYSFGVEEASAAPPAPNSGGAAPTPNTGEEPEA